MEPMDAAISGIFILAFAYGLWTLMRKRTKLHIDAGIKDEGYSSRSVDSVVEMFQQMDFEPVQQIDDSHLDRLQQLRDTAPREWSEDERKAHDRLERERVRQYAEMAMGLPGQYDDLLKEEPEDEELHQQEGEEARLQLLEEREAWVDRHEGAFEQHAQEASGQTEIGVKSATGNDSRESEFIRRLNREGAETGSIQISLIWDNFNDLDLHVFTPAGERIWFNNRRTACGGTLDVDMNVRPTSKQPVENLVWWKEPPEGVYSVCVHHYASHRKWRTRDPTTFHVRVKAEDEVSEFMGSLSHGDAMLKVCEFRIGEEQEEE